MTKINIPLEMKSNHKIVRVGNISRLILFILVFAMPYIINAQAGIRFNSEDAFKGYTLCTAESIGSTYLLDNCGKVVNVWTNTFPIHYCRLTDEGNLLYIQSNRIIEKNWIGSTVKTVTPNATNLLLDYEVMKLENGNYLAVSRRIIDSGDLLNIGWDPNTPMPDRIDGVVEIAPNGDVVWEWNIMDHTIQDRVPSVSNFGNVNNHPELVDVYAISDFDWEYGETFMINGMDYNAELDQVVISVRKVSEIMIIDHSTTTEEAKGSTGGRYGKGGDILYRWGNPQNYTQATENDRILYFQHNPNWVKYGEHKGKIIMFNNGLSRDNNPSERYSSVHIIDTPVNSDGSYNLLPNQEFAPPEADVTIDKNETGNNYYSGYTSGAQVLPNGNIYITVGAESDFIEVDEDGNVAWEYTLGFSFYIFRSEKYGPDFPGFEGRDLTGDGTVENPSSSYNCELFTSTEEVEIQYEFTVRYDPHSAQLTLQHVPFNDNYLIIKNLQGQTIQSLHNVGDHTQISLHDLPTGLYTITLFDLQKEQQISRKIIRF